MQGMLSTSSPNLTGRAGRGPVERATFGQVATPRVAVDRPADQAAPPAAVPGVSAHIPDALN